MRKGKILQVIYILRTRVTWELLETGIVFDKIWLSRELSLLEVSKYEKSSYKYVRKTEIASQNADSLLYVNVCNSILFQG